MSVQYIVAIDIESTGTDPDEHEITQIGCIVVDRFLNIDKRFKPLQLDIAPNNPERSDRVALRVQAATDPTFDRQKYITSDETMQNRLMHGLPSDRAAYLLEEWFAGLKLPPKTRLIPLAHNWKFDQVFVQNWLGKFSFEEIFDPRYRDTMVIASYLNDKNIFHGEKPIFTYVQLGYIAKILGYIPEFAHNAFDDCLTTIEVYKRLMTNTYSGIR